MDSRGNHHYNNYSQESGRGGHGGQRRGGGGHRNNQHGHHGMQQTQHYQKSRPAHHQGQQAQGFSHQPHNKYNSQQQQNDSGMMVDDTYYNKTSKFQQQPFKPMTAAPARREPNPEAQMQLGAFGYPGKPAVIQESTRKYSDGDASREEGKKSLAPPISPSSFQTQNMMSRSTAPSFESTPTQSTQMSPKEAAAAMVQASGPRFGAKPAQSQAVMPFGKSCQLFTNQYKLKLSQDLSVWQYEVSVLPDHMSDAYIMQGIFKSIKRKVDSILGLYVTSGRMVYTTTELEENLVISADFRGIRYEVIVNAENKKFFSGKQLTEAKMEDHNIIHNLLNIIVKQAFRETNLRQIGKQPRFFDISKAIEVEGSGLQACPGFRASAFNYTNCMAIVIDSINKFISNKTCLERIHEIYNSPNISDKPSRILNEFQFKTVIGGYGYKKAYFVEDIDFKKNPVTMMFQSHDGKKMSIAEYFLKTYDLKVTDTRQPLFVVKINGKDCHIPPEFCTIDGVPQTIREDPRRMRDVLASCRKNPAQKFKAIQDFSADLFNQKALREWGISIEADPLQINSQILPNPIITTTQGERSCDANMLKNLPIQRATDCLGYQRWAIVYEAKHFDMANGLLGSFQQASSKLGINVEEPHWIQVSRIDDTYGCEKQLKALIDMKQRPSIVVVMLGHERFYKMYKNMCYNLKLISQCVKYNNFGKGMNLSVASNIIRQMNSKLGGDLFRLKFSNQLNPNTMLIGIDVCHSGPNSIVGFCASVNRDRSQYYSERINQRKGQEIVGKELKDCIKRALGCFQERHGDYPQHFIIYRDGVGDAMRRQVLQQEVKSLRDAINETYNLAKTKPAITVIIVNKRITQRFFVDDGRGGVMNPPSGCLIDQVVVENSETNNEYDFYLVPQTTTQGCVLPTHFYVAHNDSDLDKSVIEKLTYDLCYYYYNWTGAIKVPAPCMYAHKIAELFMHLGKESKSIEFGERISQSLHFL